VSETLAQRLDTLLQLVRAGRAPPVIVVRVRDEAEKRLARQLLKGRPGSQAIEIELLIP
jgi:hypothetical protein